MTTRTNGKEQNAIKTLLILVFAVFFATSCANQAGSQTTLPVVDASLPAVNAKQTQTAATSQTPDNLKIFIQHQARHQGYEHNHERHEHRQNPDVAALFLDIARVEGYVAGQGWVELANFQKVNANVVVRVDQSGQPAETGSLLVPEGTYEKLRLFLGTQNFFSSVDNPTALVPLATENNERDHHGRETREQHAQDAEIRINTYLAPVVVQAGYLTTVLLQTDLSETVEAKHGHYQLDTEKVTVIEVSLTAQVQVKDGRTMPGK